MPPDPAMPPAAPSGELTFLFTDVEGSTRLWERHGEAMGEALRAHDAILHRAIGARRGHVFKTVGDAFCAAFPDAADAVAAALDGQIALAQADWPPPGRLHVRMALHSGQAEARGGDYFGRPLNRCARIEALAHGDQVLLSEATAALLAERLPAGAALVDEGSHRLRDLSRPERIFRLRHPVLPEDRPPLRSLDSRPNNLPVRPSSFLGRERELAELQARLGRTRLLTLNGVGGLGKTSLALQAAAECLDDYPDGLWFVDLAPLTEAALVASTTAAALGLREEPGRDLVDTLMEYLRDRGLLLILDNCEHLIEACAALAGRLLRHCPKLRILATSREALNVDGEMVWRVPPLALPELGEGRVRAGARRVAESGAALELGATRIDGAVEAGEAGTDPVADLLRSEAAALFVERARQVAPGFALSGRNVAAVAEICRRLDGIPLAIELAAARVPMLPPEKIAERLDQSLRLLSKGRRDARQHQATLEAAIAWSHDLCTEDEQRLFRRLAVFHGGWMAEAAEAICADAQLDAWDILDLLTRLAERSLVETEEDEGGAPRQRLLETIRQFASQQWEVSEDDRVSLREAHLAWYGRLALTGDAGLKGAEQADWLRRLEAEHDNFRAAIEWAAEAGTTAEGLRLAGHLWRFWHLRGYVSEGRRHLERLLACADAESDDAAAFAAALHAAGTLAVLQNDLAAARERLERCLGMRRELGDAAGVSATLNNLAMIAARAGDFQASRGFLEASLEVKRQLGDRWAIANTLFNLAAADRDQGALGEARSRLEESLPLWNELEDRRMEALTLAGIGSLDQIAGENRSAEAHYRASLAILAELEESERIAHILTQLGRLMHAMGEMDQARALLGRSLALALKIDDRVEAANAWLERGRLERYSGNAAAAAMAFGRSEALLADAGNPFVESTLANAVGRLACEQGKLDMARRELKRALAIRLEHGRRPWIVSAIESFALLDAAAGRMSRACTLAEAARSERRTLGMPLESFEELELGEALERATASLDTASVEAARARGAGMTVGDAVALALGDDD